VENSFFSQVQLSRTRNVIQMFQFGQIEEPISSVNNEEVK
jgi:hypothetical protein